MVESWISYLLPEIQVRMKKMERPRSGPGARTVRFIECCQCQNDRHPVRFITVFKCDIVLLNVTADIKCPSLFKN
mgnify:CR=1 FL=1